MVSRHTFTPFAIGCDAVARQVNVWPVQCHPNTRDHMEMGAKAEQQGLASRGADLTGHCSGDRCRIVDWLSCLGTARWVGFARKRALGQLDQLGRNWLSAVIDTTGPRNAEAHCLQIGVTSDSGSESALFLDQPGDVRHEPKDHHSDRGQQVGLYTPPDDDRSQNHQRQDDQNLCGPNRGPQSSSPAGTDHVPSIDQDQRSRGHLSWSGRPQQQAGRQSGLEMSMSGPSGWIDRGCSD